MPINSTQDENKAFSNSKNDVSVKNAAYYAKQLGREPVIDCIDLSEVHDKIQEAVNNKKDSISIYRLKPNQVRELELLGFIVSERSFSCGANLFIIKW